MVLIGRESAHPGVTGIIFRVVTQNLYQNDPQERPRLLLVCTAVKNIASCVTKGLKVCLTKQPNQTFSNCFVDGFEPLFKVGFDEWCLHLT